MGKIHLGKGLFWYQSIGFGQGYSGPVLGRYVRVCGGRCLLCRYGTGRSVLLRAGTGPVILCIYRTGRFRLVLVSRRDRRNCCIFIYQIRLNNFYIKELAFYICIFLDKFDIKSLVYIQLTPRYMHREITVQH